MTVEESIRKVFLESFDIYKTSANDDKDVPILCKIHDAFGGMEGPHHNCLGCNFADSQTLIYNYLSRFEEFDDIQEAISVYILLLYLLVERMETVMEIVQVPTIFRDKHFKVFQQIHKWANFIKHPKAFILTHHPVWDYEGSSLYSGREFKLTIDDPFINTYYKGEREPDK